MCALQRHGSWSLNGTLALGVREHMDKMLTPEPGKLLLGTCPGTTFSCGSLYRTPALPICNISSKCQPAYVICTTGK